MAEYAPQSQMSPAETTKPDMEAPEKDKAAPVEITLCVYPDGKLAVKIDDGEKHPAKDLDTALSAMRQLVEAEMGEGSGKPEPMEPSPEESGEEEQAFQAGYRQP